MKNLKILQIFLVEKLHLNLYDTHGFPLDLTEDMLKERNLLVDIEAFERCMNEQRTKAKAAWKGSGDDVNEGDFKKLLDLYGVNTFIGYETLLQVNQKLALFG
jgi:alanyl-tRNA synthetase